MEATAQRYIDAADWEDAIVAPNQGFWVLAKDNQYGQVYIFQNAIRKYGGAWLKNHAPSGLLTITLEPDNRFDATTIRILSGSKN